LLAETVRECFIGTGTPLVVTDALRDWPLFAQFAADETTALEKLSTRFGKDVVIINDRAPARHADAQRGRPQVSLRTTVTEYCAYCVNQSHQEASSAPRFYLNGWRAFNDHEELQNDCPMPYFMRDADLTRDIMAQIDAQLFDRSGASLRQSPPWYEGMCRALWKLFVGPMGTVTRLHCDAGDAHGWLAQLTGTKLFVLFSPNDTAALAPIAGETETVQSDVDPLACACDMSAWPTGATPFIAVVKPGEAVIIPRGWWHYAASMGTSATAQCNFYNEWNAAALTATVVRQIKGYKGKH